METLGQYGIIPVDYSTILNNLSDYKSPKDKVSKLEKAGMIIRLKKALYVISPTITKQSLSHELIANHLYGPSYISFESALSFYGLIPERVYTIKSATTKRKKVYQTPVGNYEYITVPQKYFSVGVDMKVIPDSYAFIISSPEKALCDLIISTSGLRLQSKKAMIEYLNEDLRIDFETGISFKSEIIRECKKYGYKKTELDLLSQVIVSMNTKE
jgi:predicted transcriptional regulator of viral defense system